MKIVYDRHDSQWGKSFSDPERIKVAQSWLKDDNLGFLYNDLIRDVAGPLIRSVQGSSWLTVGDGSYGSDANYLIRNGLDVHASDMYPVLLGKGSEFGFINQYSAQNAESLSFEANSFDYVFCKDALHHCPRPVIAIYEMLRVTRKAVVFLEPLDAQLKAVQQIIRLLLRREYGRYIDEFEEVGNYVYGFNERELTKICMGIGLTTCAFKRFSAYYFKGIEFVPKNGGSFPNVYKRARFHLGHAVRRIFANTGLLTHNMLCSVIFKSELPDVYPKLAAEGFKVKRLSKNPYRV